MHIYFRSTHTINVASRRKVIIFNYTGHLVLGGSIAYYLVDKPLLFAAVLIGSLWPDIDHPKSTVGRYNPFAPFMKHRGHCHSIIGILLLALPFFMITTKEVTGIEVYEMVVVGGMSHLVGDKISSALKGKKFRIKVW